MIPIGPVLENYGADLSRARRSGWAKIRCPFHDDNNASATVNLDLGKFVCFAGCLDRAQDAIGVIQHVEGLTFQAAKQEATRIAGTGDRALSRSSGSSCALLDESWGD